MSHEIWKTKKPSAMQLLRYEISANDWWMRYISHPQLQSLVGKYMARKVIRKLKAWDRVSDRKAIVAEHFIDSIDGEIVN